MRECQQRAISVTRTATILPVSGLPYSSRHEGVKTAPETAADGDGPVLVGDGPSGNRAVDKKQRWIHVSATLTDTSAMATGHVWSSDVSKCRHC